MERSAYTANLHLQAAAAAPAYRYTVRKVSKPARPVQRESSFTRAHAFAIVGAVLVAMVAAARFL